MQGLFNTTLSRVMRIYLSFFLFLFLSVEANAEKNLKIEHFIIREDISQNNKIAIIATDSLENPVTWINGTYNFTINGFKQELEFNDGIAISPLAIEKSSFLYLKHENEEGNASEMYYLFKNSSGFTLINISWYVLLAIPIGLVLLGYMFRKLIGIAVFFLMVYIYFNYSKGLSISTFLESIFDGIRNIF